MEGEEEWDGESRKTREDWKNEKSERTTRPSRPFSRITSSPDVTRARPGTPPGRPARTRHRPRPASGRPSSTRPTGRGRLLGSPRPRRRASVSTPQSRASPPSRPSLTGRRRRRSRTGRRWTRSRTVNGKEEKMGGLRNESGSHALSLRPRTPSSPAAYRFREVAQGRASCGVRGVRRTRLQGGDEAEKAQGEGSAGGGRRRRRRRDRRRAGRCGGGEHCPAPGLASLCPHCLRAACGTAGVHRGKTG